MTRVLAPSGWRRRRAALLLAAALAGCAHPAPPETPAPLAAAATAPAAAGTLVLMGTTDVHGWLLPHDYYTGQETDHGLARLLPLIDSVRAAHPGRTVLLESGDLLQGNALNFVHSRLDSAETHPVATAMNLVGYDAAAIGNHEFNFGIAHLDRVARQASFPFLAANVFRAGTQEHAYRPSVMLEREVGGRTVRIGVTAVTPPGVLIWDRDHVRGRLDFREVVASVRPVVAELRARGADVVVVASHGGLEGSSYDPAATGVPVENAVAALAREVPGVDVILMGHTHREVADTTINGVLVQQAKNWAASLAVAELRLQAEAGGPWRVVSKRGTLLRPTRAHADARLTAALAGAHERTRAYVTRVLGRSPQELTAHTARVRDTPILDFINEVQRQAAGAELSATAAFSLASRIPRGPVTVADIAGLYVYDNTLKALKISGAQLRAFLEKSAEYYLPCPAAACERLVNPEVAGYNFDVVSGVDYTLDLTKPVGQRVTRLARAGRAVQPTDSFTIALNNYRASGSGGFSMLQGAPVVYDRGEGIRELLLAEIERRGGFDPARYFRQNWQLVPPALAARALAEQAPAPRAVSGAPGAGADERGLRRKRLRVLATNDFHGALQPTKPGFARGQDVGGAAALAAYFARARRATGAPTILLDGGDVMQGTPISNLSQGRATVGYYNHVGYAAAALGNHEFDWGIETLKQRVQDAKFAWLGANVFVKGTDTLPSWVKPTALVRLPGCRGGRVRCDSVTVGIIGIATEETPSQTKPSNVASLSFRDEAAAIDRWVPRLRAQGADFVVVTAHSGAFCDRADPAQGCEGPIVRIAQRLRQRPDLIVSGHTHSRVNTVVNGVRIVQANTAGQRFSIVDLERVSPDSVATTVTQPVAYTDSVAPSAPVARLVQRYAAEAGPKINELVTFLERPLRREGGEYALGNLIADAQRAATGTQISLMNNGGIRTELLAGPVRWGDLFRLQPFANTLVTMELTGAQLLQTLEHVVAGREPEAHVSGLAVRHDPQRPRGQRVLSAVLTSGDSVRAEGRYSVTVNEFMAEGGSGFSVLEQGQNVVRTGLVDLDVLVEYLRRQPQPVPAPAMGRFGR